MCKVAFYSSAFDLKKKTRLTVAIIGHDWKINVVCCCKTKLNPAANQSYSHVPLTTYYSIILEEIH